MLPDRVMISELKCFVRRQLTRNQWGLHFVEKAPWIYKTKILAKTLCQTLGKGRGELLYIVYRGMCCPTGSRFRLLDLERAIQFYDGAPVSDPVAHWHKPYAKPVTESAMVLAFISEFLENEAIGDVKWFSLIYLRSCMAWESFKLAHALALKVYFQTCLYFIM